MMNFCIIITTITVIIIVIIIVIISVMDDLAGRGEYLGHLTSLMKLKSDY